MDTFAGLADRLDREPLWHRMAPADRTALGDALRRAGPAPGASGLLVADGAPIARVRPYGSLALYRPDARAPLRHRILDVDPDGRVETAIDRDPAGALRAAWVDVTPGPPVGILPGGATHPLWGPSDRVVRGGPDAPALLSVVGAVPWAVIDHIPALAEPARLPAQAGGALLNLFAALASDQQRAVLRYRGPYATEQLFWSLLESFLPDDGPDPVGRFLAGTEEAFVGGEIREAPVDWAPAPHERRRPGPGLLVHLRDGVEKVVAGARTYARRDGPGLRRREHRVVEPVPAATGPHYRVGLAALGTLVEEHWLLGADGTVVRARPPAADRAIDAPLDPAWTDVLGRLLPLEATPLLGRAIDAVWPHGRVVWGGVTGDLVAEGPDALRLSPKLVDAYRRATAAGPRDGARALAQALIREVLGLVGPAVRRRAADWLERLLPAEREAALAAGLAEDRAARARAATAPLGRLLAALERGECLPAPAPGPD